MESFDFEKQYERDDAGQVFLVLRCKNDFSEGEPMRLVAEVPIAELCDAAGEVFAEAVRDAGVVAGDFVKPRARLVLVNGWQSWSFAGELRHDERPRRATLKPALNLYVDHPAEDRVRALARRGAFGLGRPDIVSHFYVVLRAGRARLALVSHNASGKKDNGGSGSDTGSGGTAAAGGRVLPPVTFFVGRKNIRIAVFAEGGAFRAGETIARIAIAAGPDYFSLKDKLAGLFGAAGRFGALAFLGADAAHRQPIGGFETWYNHYLEIDEGIILRDIEALGVNDNLVNAMFLKKTKPAVFQIDDGWEKCVGDWIPHKTKFPNGIADIAAGIEEKGLIPGLWIAPFLVMPDSSIAREHPGWLLRDEGGKAVLAGWNPGWGGEVQCLDLSLPAVEEYLVDLFDTIVDVWGFRYLKLDFLYAGMMRGKRRNPSDSDWGAQGRQGGLWENYIRIMKRITSRQVAANGKPLAWLACGAPIESTAPLMPLMRIGADTKEHWDWPILRLIGHQGRPSAKVNLSHSLARSILDGTLLLNDPDVVFCRTRATTLADNEKFLIALVARMFASQVLFSDDPSEFGRGEETGGVHTEPGADAADAAGAARTAGLSEPEFTCELLALYEKLGNREFGVERCLLASPDLYRFFSRDGEVHGLINLSDRTHTLEEESPAGDSRPALVPPHSMVIFGLR